MATVPEATEQQRLIRYSNVAVTLHWLTAALVVAQVVIGFTFHEMDRGPARSDMFMWHKTVGATILVLALARLAYRLMNPPPPYPEELPRWERFAAVWNHRAFYFLLIALPLTGLIAVSGGADSATTPLKFGLDLPLVPGIGEDGGELSGEVHEILVITTLALLALHIGAAIKHVVRPNRASGRMPPFRAPTGEKPIED
ncbi:MAG: cytochrome b/b6 domain-containing protein [Pseudomonadota bacterium]|nr:cytochrome b/b6 domain-containing protein [Pseudomonadota bacterium]